jgi:hypothetical protein
MGFDMPADPPKRSTRSGRARYSPLIGIDHLVLGVLVLGLLEVAVRPARPLLPEGSLLRVCGLALHLDHGRLVATHLLAQSTSAVEPLRDRFLQDGQVGWCLILLHNFLLLLAEVLQQLRGVGTLCGLAGHMRGKVPSLAKGILSIVDKLLLVDVGEGGLQASLELVADAVVSNFLRIATGVWLATRNFPIITGVPEQAIEQDLFLHSLGLFRRGLRGSGSPAVRNGEVAGGVRGH